MDRLDRPAIRIPLRPRIEGRIRVNRPFVLVVPTYGSSEPSTAGNTNFGAHNCLAGPVTKITFKLMAAVAMLPVTILVIRA